MSNVEDLGKVSEIHVSGMAETDKGHRFAKQIKGVPVKKGEQIVRDNGVVCVATADHKKILKAAEKAEAEKATTKTKNVGDKDAAAKANDEKSETDDLSQNKDDVK